MVDSLEILLKSFANFQNIRWIWIAPKTCHASSNNTVYTAEVVVFSQHVSCLGVASSKSLSPLDRAVISVCFAIDDLIPGMKFAFLTSRVPYCWCAAIYIEAIRRQKKRSVWTAVKAAVTAQISRSLTWATAPQPASLWPTQVWGSEVVWLCVRVFG